MKYIEPKGRIDVSGVQAELAAHPDVWNEITLRVKRDDSPHREVEDIWIRYNHPKNIKNAQGIVGEHIPVWYPVIDKLPSVKRIAEQISNGRKIMGVLITRVPPGKQVYPHIDHGWHAYGTEKNCIQIKGDQKQAFCFEGEEYRANDGDWYVFDNSYVHWVTNESDKERISLIVCFRR